MKQYLLIFLLLLGTINLMAQTLYVTSGGSVVAQNTAVNIAVNATVTSGSTPLVGATVSISNNFVTGQDVLGLNGAASGGITSSYNATTGILTLSGSASATYYEATLRKVTYTNTSATPATAARVITFSLNAALPFTGNGHYFEFISSTNIAWTAANAAANLRTYFGLQGYLATITSAAENTFVYSKINAAGWLGASDAASEGVWRWVGGPEAGIQFWYGTWNGGYAVGGMYNHWLEKQPDNYLSTEHYLEFYGGDYWNDYPDNPSGVIAGYVVEYGGMTGDPVLHISDNVMVDFTPLVANLTVSSGTDIKWYNAAVNGDLLASTTPLVDGTHYYATQTVNGCESATRLDVIAHVDPKPQGSLSANGPFCATGAGTLTWTATTGTAPYTVVYNDGTANRTVTNVTSGASFAVFTTPVTSTTTYNLVSVQDAHCTRTGGFTAGSATIIVNPNPSAPTTGTHTPAQTQVVWNWNTVSGATGYKWGTTNVYADATDMLTATTKTETGLTCNTSYTRYVWAYNASGCHSTAVTLTQTTSSCVSAPSVTTNAASNIGGTTATFNGNITATGGANITIRGFKYSTTNGFDPATTGTNISESGTFGTGSFTADPSGLTITTTYYVRAYATNSAGTTYGDQVSFNTLIQTDFTYTGGVQTFTVPSGITSITIQAWGAEGGGNGGSRVSGKGGYATGVLSVTTGQVLNICGWSGAQWQLWHCG